MFKILKSVFILFHFLFLHIGWDVIQEKPQDVRPISTGWEVQYSSVSCDRRTRTQGWGHHSKEFSHKGRGKSMPKLGDCSLSFVVVLPFCFFLVVSAHFITVQSGLFHVFVNQKRINGENNYKIAFFFDTHINMIFMESRTCANL